jgi:hypothetical protein
MFRKRLVAIVVAVVLVSAVAFLVIDLDNDGLMNIQELGLFTNIISSDSDGDKLLDGASIWLTDSAELFQQFKQQGIIYRVDSEGKCQFYGENYFETSPSHFSSDEANQAKFLATISEQEYQQLESQGQLLNNNLDGDLWSNYFEKEISKTPYDVKNDVYAILMTLAGREYGETDEMNKFFEEAMKLPTENFHSLSLENNNPEKFELAIDDVAQKADKNDLVFINLGGHGSVGIFAFWGTNNVHYEWINEKLNKIDSKFMFVSVEACKSFSAMDYLKNSSNRIIMTSDSSGNNTSVGTTYEFLRAFKDENADVDSNGYVSILEAANVAIQKRWTVSGLHPAISDDYNLGQTTYLVEYQVNR